MFVPRGSLVKSLAQSASLCLIFCIACASTSRAATYREAVYGTTVSQNITYGTGATNFGNSQIDLKLDVYRPVAGSVPLPAKSPALVVIHGGGFTGGDKSEFSDEAQIYTALGYVIVSINYRLLGHNAPLEPGVGEGVTPPPPGYDTLPLPQGYATLNAAVNDAAKAFKWLQDNAATYGVDPNRIGMGGFSAGGVISTLIGYGHPTDVRPKIIMDLAGGMYGLEHLAQPGDPPAFIVHGDEDDSVPFHNAINLAAELKAEGVYHELYVQKGRGHAIYPFDFYDGKTLIEHNIDFLATFLVPEPATWGMLATGIAGFAWGVARRRRCRN